MKKANKIWTLHVLQIYVNFFAVICKTATWIDGILIKLKNVDHDNSKVHYFFGIDCFLWISVYSSYFLPLFQLTLTDQSFSEAYATSSNGSVGRRWGLLHVLNANEIWWIRAFFFLFRHMETYSIFVFVLNLGMVKSEFLKA